jgi:hypothetical protein
MVRIENDDETFALGPRGGCGRYDRRAVAENDTGIGEFPEVSRL